MDNIKIENIDIEHLKLAEYNPRRMSDKQENDLKKSIEKFGIVDPIIVNKNENRKNIVIGGHQRIKIAKQLEIKELPVVYVDLDEEKEKELNLRLNKNLGEWDFDLLAGFGKEMLLDSGFGKEDFDKIFKDSLRPEDDQIPDVPEEPVSKLGDVYELGRHRIICADSTKKEDIDRLMGGKKAQACFTDPPYNVDYTGEMGTYKKNERTGMLNDKMSKNDFSAFLSEASKRIIENVTGGVYICMSSSELDTLKNAWEQNGGHWQSFIIWVKNNFTLSGADYQHTYEPILYGWANNVTNHYFVEDRDNPNVWEDLRDVKTEYKDNKTTIQFQGFKVEIDGKVEKGRVIRKKQKTNIWRYDKPNISKEHPTMKPVVLCMEAIKNSSKQDDIVLDLFLGSGSILIACVKTNRICYGCELDPKYVDVIIKRYCDFTGNTTIKKNGEEIQWEIKE